jgi:hypothetical protein
MYPFARGCRSRGRAIRSSGHPYQPTTKDTENMSDSKKSIATIRAQADDALAKANAEHQAIVTLLDALPAATPVPSAVYPFGYCAEMSMRFDHGDNELYAKLLSLYPPEPVVYLYGDAETVKPVSYMRDREHSWARLDVFPVTLAVRSSAPQLRWWTRLNGHQVEIALAVPSATSVDVLQGNSADYMFHGNCQVKRLPKLVTRMCSMAQWDSAWSEFAQGQALRANQVQFLNAVASAVRAQPEKVWTDADFPEPIYWPPGGANVMQAGEGVGLLESMEWLQSKQAKREPHLWDRIGNFRACFSAEEVSRLLAFVEEQRNRYGAALAATKREFDSLQTAFTKFFENRGAPHSWLYSDTAERIKHIICAETGLEFSLKWMKPNRNTVSIRVAFDNRDLFRDFEVSTTLARLLPQDVVIG